MEIVFGWHLDGMTYPETCSGDLASFDSEVAGPATLLGLLETKLGLRRPAVNRTVRQTEYLRLLQKLEGEHFFSESLRNDAWNTAGHLLSLRDELVVAGWKHQCIVGLEKLNSLAQVEALGSLSDGFSERFLQIFEALQSDLRAPIGRLRLLEARAMLPIQWRNLISLLEKIGTQIDEIDCNSNQTHMPAGSRRSQVNGDLQLLQKRFSDNTENSEKLHLSGDGTLTVLDADDEMQAAQTLSTWLVLRGSQEDLVLIRSGDCSTLSQACRRNALPSPGSPARSQLKAALQVLPLAFQIVCRPIDPQALVEFLALKEGPLPDWVAALLIAAVNEAPGIGGKRWNAALDECIKRQTRFIMEEDSEITKASASKTAKEEILPLQIWFEEQVRADSKVISRTASEVICNRVEKWLSTKLATSESNTMVFELALGHAKLLKQLISVYDQESISMDLIQKMLDAVTSYGASLSGAEAADWSLVDKPGQIWGRAKTVVWWGFAQSVWSFPRRTAWTDHELSVLKEHDIVLDSLTDKLRRETWSWRMPLFHASEHLILVKPRVVSGERAIAHPLWDEIVSVLAAESVKAISFQASKLYSLPELQFAGSKIRCEAQERMPLPKALYTWNVPQGIIKSRWNESFSSIDKLIGCPLAWVLQYKAGMYQSKSLDLPQKQLLLGKLAHAVVNEMYIERKPWNWAPEEGQKYAAAAVERLLPEMAAALLSPEAGPQLREATEAIPRSVYHLSKFLKDANVTVEGSEQPLFIQLNSSTKLKGDVDLLLRLPNGGRAVLDFKWSSSPYWYRKRIVEGRALQLAIYSWLALQTDEQVQQAAEPGMNPSGKMPPAGFFMFRQGELFFTESGLFPDFTLVRRMQRDLDSTWKLTLETYEKILSTLHEGEIHARGITDDVPLDAYCHKIDLVEPPCRFCKYSHFCGVTELT